MFHLKFQVFNSQPNLWEISISTSILYFIQVNNSFFYEINNHIMWKFVNYAAYPRIKPSLQLPTIPNSPFQPWSNQFKIFNMCPLYRVNILRVFVPRPEPFHQSQREYIFMIYYLHPKIIVVKQYPNTHALRKNVHQRDLSLL